MIYIRNMEGMTRKPWVADGKHMSCVVYREDVGLKFLDVGGLYSMHKPRSDIHIKVPKKKLRSIL